MRVNSEPGSTPISINLRRITESPRIDVIVPDDPGGNFSSVMVAMIHPIILDSSKLLCLSILN